MCVCVGGGGGEGGGGTLGVSPKKFDEVILTSTATYRVYNTITKYSISIGLAEADDSCP